MNLSTLYKKLTNRKYTFGYKFVLSLFVGLIGISSFCSAETIIAERIKPGSYYTRSPSYFDINKPISNYKLLIFSEGDCLLRLYQSNYSTRLLNSTYSNGVYLITFDSDYQGRIYVESSQNSFGCYAIMLFDGNIPDSGDCPDCPICTPQYTSEECQSQYGLVSSGALNTCENNYNNCQTDLNSCQNNTSGFNDLLNNCSNNLNACNNSLTSCLQQNCPETVTGTNRSSLFINNIQYPGAPTINFTIPEEIERDQYTDEEETNIDVVGYGYDQDKMQQMVNTQYYKPTSEEMSDLIGKVADFLPLIAVALLIIRIRRVLKKVFRF